MRRFHVLSLAVTFLWLLLLVVAPFAAAGVTGNPLWIAVPVMATLLYVAWREAPRCLAYYRSLWPWHWLACLMYAVPALIIALLIGLLVSLAPAGTVLDWSLGSAFHVPD